MIKIDRNGLIHKINKIISFIIFDIDKMLKTIYIYIYYNIFYINS